MVTSRPSDKSRGEKARKQQESKTTGLRLLHLQSRSFRRKSEFLPVQIDEERSFDHLRDPLTQDDTPKITKIRGAIRLHFTSATIACEVDRRTKCTFPTGIEINSGGVL